MLRKQEALEDPNKKPVFTLELFKVELAKAQEESMRSKFFGPSQFVSDILKGKLVSYHEIRAYAQTHPFGTVSNILDKFENSDQGLALAWGKTLNHSF